MGADATTPWPLVETKRPRVPSCMSGIVRIASQCSHCAGAGQSGRCDHLWLSHGAAPPALSPANRFRSSDPRRIGWFLGAWSQLCDRAAAGQGRIGRHGCDRWLDDYRLCRRGLAGPFQCGARHRSPGCATCLCRWVWLYCARWSALLRLAGRFGVVCGTGTAGHRSGMHVYRRVDVGGLPRASASSRSSDFAVRPQRLGWSEPWSSRRTTLDRPRRAVGGRVVARARTNPGPRFDDRDARTTGAFRIGRNVVTPRGVPPRSWSDVRWRGDGRDCWLRRLDLRFS